MAKKESARAKMRMMIKKLLKKYKYPPEGAEDALRIVMIQCELWTDNSVFHEKPEKEIYAERFMLEGQREYRMVAEETMK